jgi:hypothetical protein
MKDSSLSSQDVRLSHVLEILLALSRKYLWDNSEIDQHIGIVETGPDIKGIIPRDYIT